MALGVMAVVVKRGQSRTRNSQKQARTIVRIAVCAVQDSQEYLERVARGGWSWEKVEASVGLLVTWSSKNTWGAWLDGIRPLWIEVVVLPGEIGVVMADGCDCVAFWGGRKTGSCWVGLVVGDGGCGYRTGNILARLGE